MLGSKLIRKLPETRMWITLHTLDECYLPHTRHHSPCTLTTIYTIRMIFPSDGAYSTLRDVSIHYSLVATGAGMCGGESNQFTTELHKKTVPTGQ